MAITILVAVLSMFAGIGILALVSAVIDRVEETRDYKWDVANLRREIDRLVQVGGEISFELDECRQEKHSALEVIEILSKYLRHDGWLTSHELNVLDRWQRAEAGKEMFDIAEMDDFYGVSWGDNELFRAYCERFNVNPHERGRLCPHCHRERVCSLCDHCDRCGEFATESMAREMGANDRPPCIKCGN